MQEDQTQGALPRQPLRPKLRILLSNTIRLWAGAERFVLDAAVGLTERAHEVTVQSYPGTPLLERANAAGLKVMATRVRTDAAPWTVLPLAWRLRRQRFDVVWTTRDKDLRTTGLAAKLAGRGIKVVHSRECDDPIKQSPQYRWFFRAVANRVVVNSESTARTTLNSAPWLAPERMDLLYKGIELAPWENAEAGDWPQRFGVKDGEVVLGYAGQLVPRKRVDLLMRLLAGDTLRSKPWRLVLAGKGPAEGTLRSLAEELRIEDRVCFCGFVEELPAWMKAIDFLVLPSLIEGFGYVLTEAMAASRPVTAYGASSIPEIVRDGVSGLIAPARDDASLAPLLSRLIEDPQLRREMGAKGHDEVRTRFSLDTMLDTMEEILWRACCGALREEKQA